MNCEDARRNLPDWLAGTLLTPERAALDAHLAGCPACQAELAEARALWQLLGDVPTPAPSEQLRVNFYATLADFRAEETARQQAPLHRLGRWLQAVWSPRAALRLAYSLALLVVGWAAGYGFGSGPTAPANPQQLATLTAEVAQLRETMLLTLLDNPSATERLRAVSYTKDLRRADPRVVEALLTTLNHDPNANVRLATLEALTQLAADPAVRAGLVKAFAYQESPLVQTALADVMVHLQERRSVPQLRRLLRQPNLNVLVKDKLEQSLDALGADRRSTAL